ncbi:MAG: hypothetical protein OXD30_03160 [Bryobacterales bacterium]|nr:hypothetical protein [Bryobacterales bacterium]
MGLLNWFRPKWRHSDADVRIESLAQVSEPETLADIIVADSEWFVRHEAFAKLRSLAPDQSHYARLMRESDDEEIRRKAVKIMTDVTELERVAKEDKYLYVRDAAQHRLEEIRTGGWGQPAS